MADLERPLRDDYDSPWKEALVGYLPEFFEFFFPDIGNEIDWTQPPIFRDKELRQMEREAELGKREADALVEVRRRDGEEIWVLIHIEVQAQWEPQLPLRMFVSFYRIFDMLSKPICSLAVLADSHPRWRPANYSNDLWGTKISLDYRVAKLKDYDTPELLAGLEQSLNPFAHLVAATLHAQNWRPDSQKRAQIKFRLVRNLFGLGLDKRQVQEFFRLIDWVLLLSPTLEQAFKVQLHQIEEEKRMPYITSIERLALEEGREEGREKGLEEGLEKSLKVILEARFCALPNDVAKRLEALSAEQLEALLREAATAGSLEEFTTKLP